MLKYFPRSLPSRLIYGTIHTSSLRRRCPPSLLTYKSFATMNSLDRLFMKPVLIEEDSTDDEYDEELNRKLRDGEEDIESELDDQNEPLPQKRIGREILKLGRVNYRVPEILPEWINQRKDLISENRTTKQLRRCIKNWMLKPDRDRQKKYAEKEVGWANTAPRDAAKEASRVMSYGPEETVAYVNFFMPSRYVITRRVFNELKSFLPKYRPRRIFDFGCGPATCAAAAVDVWGLDAVERYVGVDMSQSMLDAAKIMTTSMGLVNPTGSNPKKSHSDKLSFHDKKGPDVILTTKSADVIGRIAAAKDDSQRFDMAVAAYTLSELTSDSVKRAAVQVMFEALDNNGILVIIDNGSPIGSHHTRSARQMLLDLFGNKENLPQSDNHRAQNPTKDIEIRYVLKPTGSPRFSYEDYEVSVIAPCTHDGTCPLRPGSWCSFPQRAQSSLIRKNNEEKFSYVVLQKKLKYTALARHPTDHSLINNAEDFWLSHIADSRIVSADPTPLNIVQRFLDYEHQDTNPLAEELMEEVDFDDYNPPLVRREYGRILRSPIKKKEHVVMDLCQSDGYLTRTTISKSSAWNIPHFYSAIRKLRWGGIVPALPVTTHDISAHQEKKSDEKGSEPGFQPILVMSPLARHRPSTTPAVRRDIKPPERVTKNIFAPGEGPQGRYERNRDARESGIELYQLKSDNPDDDDDTNYEYDDLPRDAKEEEELAEMMRDEEKHYEIMSKYSKTIDAMRKDERLMGREIGEDDNEDGDSSSDSDSEAREKLAGFDSSDDDISEEEKKRLLNMSDEDWQEWMDILEGKDALRTKGNKAIDEDNDFTEEVPALSERKRRKAPQSTDGDILPTSRAKRGSTMNEALLPKQSRKTKASTTIDATTTPTSPPPSIPSTGGRKKSSLIPRRSRKSVE